jgi:DNA-binding transcriptional ArsR family regulator
MELRRQRLAIARLYIELGRGLHAELGFSKRYGDRPELLPVACAVMVGHLTGMGMSASAIARFLEMPRTSVMRRLEALKRAGVVELKRGTWCIPSKRFNGKGQGTLSAMRVIRQMIKPFSDEPTPPLSTLVVAPPLPPRRPLVPQPDAGASG